MSRYHIHIDPNLPDPDRIDDHQDFDALFREYRTVKRFDFWRNLYKKPRVFAGVAAMFAIIFLVVQSMDESVETQAYDRLGAPVSGVLSPDQVWNLSGTSDTTLYLSERLSLYIPAGSVVDSAGESVDQYDLHFRDFNLASEQFVSGVQGAESPFRLEAWDGEETLFAGEGIELIVRNELPDLLLQEEGNWLALAELPGKPSDEGPLEQPVKPAILNQEAEIGSKSAGPAPQRPGKPFGVKVGNLRDFPQFRGYENVFWEYVPYGDHADPWADGLINDTVSQVRVQPFRGNNTYELWFRKPTASGGMTQKKVVVRPYASARTESEALQVYRDRMAEYEEARQAWQFERDQIRQLEAEIRRARIAYDNEMAAWREATTAEEGDTFVPHNRYQLSEFGVVGFEAQTSSTDSVEVEIFLSKGAISETEGLVRVFSADPGRGIILEASPNGANWKLPTAKAGTMIWAYGAEHIWIGQIPTTGIHTQVELSPLPENIEEAEQVIRHLQGVL